MKKNKKTSIIVGGIVLILLIIGIGFMFVNKDISNVNNNKTEDKTPNKNPIEIAEEIEIVDLKSPSRPLAIIIENENSSRQVQSGLSKAYVVYEMIAEGGISRFLALFKDVDIESIGAIRSARDYFLDYVLENDAIFVHWGWSPQAKIDIPKLKINNIHALNGLHEKYFTRYNPLKLATEHTGFSKMEWLTQAIEDIGYRKELNTDLILAYSPKSVDLTKYNETSATDVTIDYSKVTKNKYIYDEESKTYKRYVNGQEQKDFLTKEQIMVKNIIVYKVNNYAIPKDPKNRQKLENLGSGKGYYITEGNSVEITWKKDSRESKTRYYFEDGTELKVNDGNTFIQIMPTSGELIIK